MVSAKWIALVLLMASAGVSVSGQGLTLASRPPAASAAPATTPIPVDDYILGPEDQISLWISDATDLSNKPVTIDAGGYIKVPLAGRVKAGGLTVRQLETSLTKQLSEFIVKPEVTVSVAEYRSQPVSVLGGVNNAGVHQLRGRKTLLEILSMAGGLKPDAGSSVVITRHKEWGSIPLPQAVDDPTGEFSVAEINLTAVMKGLNPGENIVILPNDAISVPRAQMVYVVGDVEKPGGFVLTERKNMSVLQAISLAGGLRRTAAGQETKILRAQDGSSQRSELPVDVKKILTGKGEDLALGPEDILFVPSSAAKRAGTRAAEAAIQILTGVAVYGRY